MDWKRESIDELRTYKQRKSSLDSLRQSIAQMESDLTSIGGVPSCDGGHAGYTDPDEKIVNKIVKLEKLKKSYQVAKTNINAVERGLSVCDEEQRTILDAFYISRERGNVEKLCEQLHVEQSSIYRRKDQALRAYTIARYGITEIV